MKTALILIALSLSISASPLLLKTAKEISSDGSEELAVFDSTKYRQIRIGLKIIRADLWACESGYTFPDSDVELKIATDEYERAAKLAEAQSISANALKRARDRVDSARQMVNAMRNYPCSFATIAAADTTGDFTLETARADKRGGTSFFTIDSPPSSIRITGFGKGKYSIYIWGQ